jgi:mono/diheme cytochrome c family protein
MPLPRRVLAAALILCVADPVVAQPEPAPFLARHCLSCHRGEKAKGGFRADRLTADFADPANRERWRDAVERVRAGEMPPADRPRPDAAEAKGFVEYVERTDAARRAVTGRVPLRRLNRIEYENTVRDLLGIELDLRELLPPDTSANGFDTNSGGQHVSSYLMDRYLDAADAALAAAISNSPKGPPVIGKRYSLKDERHVKVTTEKVFRHRDDGLVMFSSSAWQAITSSQFYPPDRGRYRFRITASAVQSGGRPVAFRVDAGPMLMGTKNRHVGYFDAPADKAVTVEFTEYLEARSTIRLLPYGLASAQAVHKVGADAYDGPGLLVHGVEVDGPLYDAWPPAGHRRLFGDLAQGPAPVFNKRDRVEVISKAPEADAERLIRDFAGRAFRRSVTDAEVRPFVALAKQRLADGSSFEQAVRAGFAGVLVSPHFLFLRENAGKLDDFALAARLSYFLTSTAPDAELLALAAAGKLGDPAVLRAQTDRLLNGPRSAAFVENFVGQWLGLRDIDFTEPSHILYPEYDHALRVAMVREAELFFAAVLADDLPLTNFVASDFSILNARLARHYGIPGVDGWDFRHVRLPADSHRGGVLTMGGVLKVTANGTSTSPVVRGAWVMDRILGTPPPKPPPDIPAVEPDTRGATTIREQLAKHRSVASCATCHAKIDPPGFALESFDVIGGYREHYRTTGRGQPVTVDGRRMAYHQGPKVDPADTLPDGSRFAGIDELKRLLVRDKDQLARALAVKLVTYGTGGPPEPADRAEVEAVVARVRDRGYGFRALIHEIVQSQLFREK